MSEYYIFQTSVTKQIFFKFKNVTILLFRNIVPYAILVWPLHFLLAHYATGDKLLFEKKNTLAVFLFFVFVLIKLCNVLYSVQ